LVEPLGSSTINTLKPEAKGLPAAEALGSQTHHKEIFRFYKGRPSNKCIFNEDKGFSRYRPSE